MRLLCGEREGKDGTEREAESFHIEDVSR
jgi:hypothetical protein